MYIQLVDKHGSESPLLYIHSDHEEFMAEINKWKGGLLEWAKQDIVRGLPLGRLEASTCMVDLLHHLTGYFVECAKNDLAKYEYFQNRITNCLRLLNSDYLDSVDEDEVVKIKTYE